MEEVFITTVSTDRLTLDQYLEDPESYGIEDIASITYDPGHLVYTQDDIDEAYSLNEAELKEMLTFPYEELSDRQKLVFDKMYYEYLIALWSLEVPDYSTQLGLTSGLITNLAITFYEYIFDTEENVETYAKVMEYLPDLLLEIPEQVKSQIEELDYAPTDYMIDTALESIEELLDLEDNPFIDGYNTKIDALGLTDDVSQSYKDANEEFYIDEIVPALEQVYEELEELYGLNSTGQGLYYYDGGLEYYEYLVEDAVGANMTIDELMELLDETLTENVSKLVRYATLNSTLYEQYYSEEISLIDEDDPEQILEYLIEAMSDAFPSLGEVSWLVSALPDSLEIDGVLAYYLVPRIDAADVNIMRVNESALDDDPVTLFMTLAHEGYPGHMLQFNIQQSCGAYSVEQLISHLGYSEGWAMYAEYMSLDFTDVSEAMKTIILLDSCINYDLYAYADLAINGKGWTEDDLADYISALGLNSSAASYIYAVCVGDPGVFLPYSLGYILTDEIIEDYATETGAEYSEIYELYMSIGAAPFEVVKKYLGTEF